jgi:hypothetical protein
VREAAYAHRRLAAVWVPDPLTAHWSAPQLGVCPCHLTRTSAPIPAARDTARSSGGARSERPASPRMTTGMPHERASDGRYQTYEWTRTRCPPARIRRRLTPGFVAKERRHRRYPVPRKASPARAGVRSSWHHRAMARPARTPPARYSAVVSPFVSPSPGFRAVEPMRCGIIIGVSGVRVPPPA